MQNYNFIKRGFIFLILALFLSKTYAQTGLNFQGVARTNNNVILASQDITIKLSILKSTATGNAEYTEIRKVTTNAQGLFTAVIGDTGAISTLGNFNTINWKLSPKFLKIEMDPAAGNNFITMGTTQFQYVAYAQFAKSVDAENIVGILPISKGGTGLSTIAELKSALALDKINNTADADKPISTKTQTALDLISVTATDTTRFLKRINSKADTADVILITKTLETKLNIADTIKFTKQAYSDSSLLTKLKISDTSALLSSRIAKDTLNLSKRINSKADTVDISMITKTLGTKLNAADTIKFTKQAYSDSSLLTKLKISDTAAMLNSRISKDTLILSNRINLKANTTDVTLGLELKENISNKSTSADLGGVSPSDVLFPTQKAVKDYVTANNASGGISDGSVTTIKLDNLAVTDAKLASGISKSKVGLGNVENTALSTWVGTNNITTLGTIATGTWSGTTIAIASGGTGVATTTANSFFAGPNGSAGAPSFRTLVASDLPTISTSYIQNTPDATQTGSIDISGNAKIRTALNVNGIYIGIGIGNQTTNTVIGNTALQGIDDGYNNTTIGNYTMKENNGGYNNTSVGANALQKLSNGNDNTALGYYAMLNSTTGKFNTATGSYALSSNTGSGNTGSYNVANGYNAMLYNQTGSKNVGIGYYTLLANRTGSNNTAIGNQADVASGDLTNATAIGNGAIVSASNTIQLGNSSVSSVTTSGSITALSFIGTLNGNATTATYATIAGNITATTNTTLTTLSSLTSVGTIASLTTGSITNSGKVIVGASSAASTSAVLEVSSTTQGFLPPRLNYYQITQITSPVAGLTVWCNNCGVSGEMQVFNGGAWTNMSGGTATATISLSIGDSYQGGKVAYLLVDGDIGYDANTQHGLIAATSDQGTVIYWNTGFNNITGATGTAIGTGLSNTDKFIVSHGAYTNFAPGLARAYRGGGYFDWYLPSKDELGKLILNENAIGAFEWGSRYWSSSEFNIDKAYYYYVGHGFYTGIKNLAQSRVRAVRSF